MNKFVDGSGLTQPSDESLEGDVNVKLPPVRGKDERRSLDRSFFHKKPLLFVTKYIFAMALIGLSWSIIAYQDSYFIKALAVVFSGLMYAHLIELQHECLHNHAFNSPKLNRLFGVLCGIFMLVSHSHYRYDHLRHHAYLGTEDNLEHFDYKFQGLNSIRGFLLSFFDLSRYKKVFAIFFKAVTFKTINSVEKKSYSIKIKQEYVLYVMIFSCSVISSLYFQTWFFVFAWWMPALLIAEGTHFMIEFPEHYGLNSQSDPNVLSNTRTIYTRKLFSWFVNGNDLHTAHHFHQGVPMCNIKKLQRKIQSRIHEQCVESSYLRFYYNVITGKTTQVDEHTAMNR